VSAVRLPRIAFREMLMSRFRTSLRYKIGLLMLLLSLLPLAFVGVIVLTTVLGQLGRFGARMADAENSLRSEVVGRNLKGAAVDTATDIDNYMLARIIDVRRWSDDRDVIEAARQGTLAARQAGLNGLAPDALEAGLQGGLFVPISPTVFSIASSYLFQQVERPETPFIEILVTEASGINVLITRPMPRLAHSDRAWWRAAHDRGVAGIGVDDLGLDPASNAPVIGLALPIIDPDTKETLGVIRGLLRLADLQRRLSQKAVSVGGDLRVFARDGRLIADTVSDHAAALILTDAGNVVKRDYLPALKALQAVPGMDSAGFLTVESGGARDIAGYSRTSGRDYYDARAQVADFAGFDWGVVVTQPESRALQVLRALIETGRDFERLLGLLGGLFGVVLVLVVAISLAGAILLSGSITRPLLEVSQMAQRVQAGDLTASVHAQSQDEVGMLARTFNTMTAGLRERERERDIFGRVVSPEVREKLLDGKLELGGETRWVAVLFSDIRNFSTTSEKMDPQELVAFLNEYLTEMTTAIRPWGGYLNNFIGDAIVAIFGAPIDQPDKEWRAVAAALTMRRRLDALNQRRAARGEAPIDSGIGIGTGEAVAGQVGSLERLMYTVIGDAVNVAARLEALTKEYKAYPILINGPTARALRARDDVMLTSLGPISVKGRAEPVDVWAVIEGRVDKTEMA
jgi:class 3 adenylate cyclase